MKIGLFGGVANNMYVFAKSFREYGVDVCFIRDRSDLYPFSQPIWEDVELTQEYAEVSRSAMWTWDKWSELESNQGWRSPQWMYDPRESLEGEVRLSRGRYTKVLDRLTASRYLKAPSRRSVLAKMEECDALMVCGVEGSILARLSGKPFIAWPHGGDLMLAAGMLMPPVWKLRQRLVYSVLSYHLRIAFREAICIGNHEPSGITTAFFGAEDYVRNLNVVYMPIPIPLRRRAPLMERRSQMKELLFHVGINPNGKSLVGFVPSRVDYRWKGQDRLLTAVVSIQNEMRKANACLVFAGWGDDLAVAKRYAKENQIEDVVFFLGVALSKPLLFKFYQAADFVVDQFTLGMYGTAALEAMASGCPLMIWLNQKYERSWGAPPVMNVQSSEEIEGELRAILSGQRDLDAMGTELQSWMSKTHDPKRVVGDVMAVFANPRSASRGW